MPKRTEARWCVHCDLTWTTRGSGLCNACHAYEHKMGQLPSRAVLQKRQRRRDEERFAKQQDGSYACAMCLVPLPTPRRGPRPRVCNRCRQRLAAGYAAKVVLRLRSPEPPDDLRVVEVFERDGWACGICGEDVNRQLRFPHPASASIDHIVQLNQGGTNTADNVRLAHLGCNMRRPKGPRQVWGA